MRGFASYLTEHIVCVSHTEPVHIRAHPCASVRIRAHPCASVRSVRIRALRALRARPCASVRIRARPCAPCRPCALCRPCRPCLVRALNTGEAMGGAISAIRSYMRLRETWLAQDLVRDWSRDHCPLALVQDHPVEQHLRVLCPLQAHYRIDSHSGLTTASDYGSTI